MANEKKGESFFVNAGMPSDSLEAWFNDAKKMSDIVSIYVRLATIIAVITILVSAAAQSGTVLLYIFTISAMCLSLIGLAYLSCASIFCWMMTRMVVHNVLSQGYLNPINPDSSFNSVLRDYDKYQEGIDEMSAKEAWRSLWHMLVDMALDFTIALMTLCVTLGVIISCFVIGIGAGLAIFQSSGFNP